MKNVKVIDPVSLGFNGVTISPASPTIIGPIVNVTQYEEFYLMLRFSLAGGLALHQGPVSILVFSETASTIVGGGADAIPLARIASFAGWLSSTGANQNFGTPAGGNAGNINSKLGLFWSRSGANNLAQYSGYGLQTKVFYHQLRIQISGLPIAAGDGFDVTAALGGA